MPLFCSLYATNIHIICIIIHSGYTLLFPGGSAPLHFGRQPGGWTGKPRQDLWFMPAWGGIECPPGIPFQIHVICALQINDFRAYHCRRYFSHLRIEMLYKHCNSLAHNGEHGHCGAVCCERLFCPPGQNRKLRVPGGWDRTQKILFESSLPKYGKTNE